jgi:hypothetical protein
MHASWDWIMPCSGTGRNYSMLRLGEQWPGWRGLRSE